MSAYCLHSSHLCLSVYGLACTFTAPDVTVVVTVGCPCSSYRYFHYIGNDDVDRRNPHSCDRIPGSSKLHSVLGPDRYDPTKLLVRELSCFCGPCLEYNFNNCENKVYVKSWTAVKIQAYAIGFALPVHELDDGEDIWDWEYSEDGMVDLVQAGNNFAVPAAPDNDEGISFYILQCQTPKEMLTEDLTCAWGGHFKVGDYVISGTYYQKWGRSDLHNYVYLANSQVAHIDANIVLACKFGMLPK